MEPDTTRTEIVEAQIEEGVTIRIQAVSLGGEERIAGGELPSFNDVMQTIEGLSKAMVTTLKKAKPRAASVEFGIEVGIESGKLTALLVKGTATANLKVVLQWGEVDSSITV